MSPFDKFLSTMMKPWMIVTVLGLITLSYIYLDQPIAYFFYGLDLRDASAFWNFVTDLGLGAAYFVSLFLLGLFFRFIYRSSYWESRAWFLWLCVVIPSIFCFVLKVLFGRARPGLLFDEQLYGFYGLQTHAPFWSFPSGHTTTIMGFVFGLSILYPRFCYRLIILGSCIALSRVLLVHHYFSDVLSASYFALIEVGLLMACLRRCQWLNSTCLSGKCL